MLSSRICSHAKFKARIVAGGAVIGSTVGTTSTNLGMLVVSKGFEGFSLLREDVSELLESSEKMVIASGMESISLSLVDGSVEAVDHKHSSTHGSC